MSEGPETEVHLTGEEKKQRERGPRATKKEKTQNRNPKLKEGQRGGRINVGA